MRLEETAVAGVRIVRSDPHVDERGTFAPVFSAEEFAAGGVAMAVRRTALSLNSSAGTLRGLHFQAPPHDEAKLVTCAAGALFDVAVDLRPRSPTFKRWFGVELRAGDGRSLYIPEGCAHGYLTLLDETLVSYALSAHFVPGAARGVRFDDPAFQIAWPFPPRLMSRRDAELPFLGPVVSA